MTLINRVHIHVRVSKLMNDGCITEGLSFVGAVFNQDSSHFWPNERNDLSYNIYENHNNNMLHEIQMFHKY